MRERKGELDKVKALGGLFCQTVVHLLAHTDLCV